MSDRSTLRRKHAGVDLNQVVIRVREYQRSLNSSASAAGSGKVLGFMHLGIVATTENGKLYLIEKGVPEIEDINYQVRYREGHCRIVQIHPRDMRDWQLCKALSEVKSGLTLEDLFDACGSDYNAVIDNCWNGTHRMRACANPQEEGGLAWQEKAIIGGLAVGAGIALAASLLGSDEKKKQKY